MAGKQLTRRQVLGASTAVLAGAALTPTRGLARGRRAGQEFAGKTVTVGTIDGELGNGVQAQMAAFEAATGARIELVRIPQDELQTKITADLTSGAGTFDVIIEPFILLHGHAAAGFYLPLEEFTAEDPDVDLEDFIPLLLQGQGYYNDTLYGLPYKADAYIFFYRKDLFGDPAVQGAFSAQVGRELAVPQTVPELVETARFFTREFNPESPTEFGWSHMAAEGTNPLYIWASRLAVYGGSYVDENFRPNFNNDAGRRAMEVAIQLNECCPPDVGSYSWEEANTAYLTGRVAMMEQWPGLAKIAETEEGFWGRSEVIGKTGYAPMVGDDVGGQLVRSSILGGWTAAVSKFAEDPQLAYRTVAFLTGKEGEPLKIPAGNDPCRQSTYANPEIAEANPLYPVLQENLAQGRITPDPDAPPVSAELGTEMATVFNRVWSGQLGGEEALVEVEERWTDILRRARLTD
ncbi:MAG: sugar ABC transporter substrate-binding protein, partial [Chloroflexota bacterium]|nr:sugar ABC transporter substrate-binding protein [Chloroflexota bacterium]